MYLLVPLPMQVLTSMRLSTFSFVEFINEPKFFCQWQHCDLKKLKCIDAKQVAVTIG